MLEAALIALLAASGADTATSMAALAARPGQVREWNPALRPLTDQPAVFGAVKLGATSGLALYLLAQRTQHPRLVTTIALIGAAGFTAAAIHNQRALRR